jgi:hypothetical protein
MPSLLTRCSSRTLAVPLEWGHPLPLAFTATSRFSPPREQAQRGASYVEHNSEA